ncbi:hypothetical protein NQ314_014891, partial [Rhamnusium bicolor]
NENDDAEEVEPLPRSLEGMEDEVEENIDEEDEGLHYPRLDPSGRGKGDCELLDLPLTQLDIGRDLYPDPDYDYYERDRNAASANCKQWPRGGGGWYGGGYGGSPGGGSGGRDEYHKYGGGYGGGGSYYYDHNRNEYDSNRRYDGGRRPDYKGLIYPPVLGERRPEGYDTGLRRPGDTWVEDNRYDNGRPDLNGRYDNRRKPNYDDDYRPGGNRRGDFSYHHLHSQQDYENSRHYYNDRERYDYKGKRRYSGIHYLPAYYHKPYYEPDRYDYKSHEPYLPPKHYHDRPYEDKYDDKRYYNRNKHWDYWGLNNPSWGSYGGSYGNFGNSNSYYGYNNQFNNRNRYDIDRRNYYLPSNVEIPKDWGLYGGSYGTGGSFDNGEGYHQYNNYRNNHSYNYWGFYKYEEKYNDKKYYHDFFGESRPNRKPSGSSYLPLPGPPNEDNYLPLPKPLSSESYLPKPPTGSSYLPLPAKPSYYESHFGHRHEPISNNYFNSILPAEPRRPPTYDFIKDVPNIYECELLCFKEKDFPCASYAYRYTINLAPPTDNCYLSNRNYKELDYYTDLEPDRDFDIYTMNNMNTCEAPIIQGKDNSDCFWRVRSGQRLDQKVVRDSLTVKSIVDCQIECLRSIRFTCRAFSYRYGSPVIGGVIDNCQLTDWPYYELDPRINFIPERGFEVYERGSFGHGCEPDHFGIRGKHKKDPGTKADQRFGSPARLLPQATKKSLRVATELDCKAECSKVREGTLFQCMSFSYRSSGPKALPNCELSDILQRDLLPNVDYVYDPDSWLFAWDNYSPDCIALANEPLHDNHIIKETGIDSRHDWDVTHTLNTWRLYSVSGWPCRRGSLCQENREAGFWFCELQGGDKGAWDYCCRPDHQCGASNGYPYQWCYVGPAKTQWRKCSDRYYPYVHNIFDRLDHSKPYLPPAQTSPWTPPPFRPGVRPDRPPRPPLESPPRPSLDEYETQFDNEFLDPPKPGGFGQARHWPVSYLHKEMPPNSTDSEPRLMRMEKEQNPKYAAIQNLINVIKNNDLKNVQYHISNESNKADDILFVRIPLPTNFTKDSKSLQSNYFSSNTSVNLEPVYSDEGRNIQTKRSHKSLPLTTTRSFAHKETNYRDDIPRLSPVYRRGFVTRTNITHRQQTLF